MRFLALAPLLLLAACNASEAGDPAAPKVAPVLDTPEAVDNQTFAKPLEARVVHVDLDLDLDFAEKKVSGTAMLDLIAKPGVEQVILDNDGLDIASVTDGEGKPLEYEVGEVVEGKGAPLTITMGEAREITIAYSASDAEALQWLSPEQTAGGKQPYLFSQGQATLNRTWIPT